MVALTWNDGNDANPTAACELLIYFCLWARNSSKIILTSK